MFQRLYRQMYNSIGDFLNNIPTVDLTHRVYYNIETEKGSIIYDSEQQKLFYSNKLELTNHEYKDEHNEYVISNVRYILPKHVIVEYDPN